METRKNEARSEALDWLYTWSGAARLCSIDLFGTLQATHTAYQIAEILAAYTVALCQQLAANEEEIARLKALCDEAQEREHGSR